MLDHQVVHLVHGTGGRIFDGQNAVLTQPLIDGTEHGLKGLEVHNKWIFEDFFTGDLGVSALHALTGDHGRLGEELGRMLDGLRDVPVKGAAFPVALGLVAAAQLEQHGVQHPSVIGHFGTSLFRHVLKLRPFPGRLENGQVIGLFVVGDLSGNMHPLAEQANQFVVDFVDLTANLIQVHLRFPPVCLGVAQNHVENGDGGRGLDHRNGSGDDAWVVAAFDDQLLHFSTA